MKKFYTFFVLAFTVVVGNAQIVNIPDANFKAKLLAASATADIAYNVVGTKIKIDTNSDGNIQLSEALTVYKLAVQSNTIADLTGLASFTNLRSLNCSSNQITTLDVSNRTNLTFLNCQNNSITSLNITNDLALNFLDISSNQLQSINLDPFVNLQELDMGANPYLNSINIDNLINLVTLTVNDLTVSVFPLNNTSMPFFTHLNYLITDNTLLGNFNYGGLPSLTSLYCRNTQLTNLNLTNLTNLIGLACERNQLTTLDLSPLINIQSISFWNNPINNLVLGNHPNLSLVFCGNNNFASIDLSNYPISLFNCNISPVLTSVNIKNGTIGSSSFLSCPNLIYICADEGEVTNIQNAITANGYTNCHVNTYCSFVPGGTFYTIQGNHRWDTNNNGCDASDFLFPNMKFNISNGTATTTLISGNDGSYHYDVQAGTYTIAPVFENPTYFTTTPTSATTTFPATASPFIQDFCVRSNGIHNDLDVSILPINDAVAGLNSTYKIVYKNKGTIMQSGTVNLDFDDSKTQLVSAIPTISNQSSNNLS